MGRLEVGVEHLAEERPSGRGLVPLILHRHPVGAVVVKDRAPRVEQVPDAILNASQPLFAFGLVLQGAVR